MIEEISRLAELAFKAYNVDAGGLTWDGKHIPEWQDVGEKVQAHWRAAVQAIWQDIYPDTSSPDLDINQLLSDNGD